MIRRRHNDRFARRRTPQQSKNGRPHLYLKRSSCTLLFERLEDRYLLSASTGQGDAASLLNIGPMLDNPAASSALVAGGAMPVVAYEIDAIPPFLQDNTNEQILASGAATPTSPYPLDQTFLLSSFPSATKTIYLDFDGFTTRNTPWNADFQPNIVTLPFDFDNNYIGFSDAELTAIQKIWQRVSEDYRPFQVNVTTQDPGIDALTNAGGLDDTWGVRAAIGGSTNDWYTPVTTLVVGGVAHLGSFTSSIDDPVFIFSGDAGNQPAAIAEAVSHEVGHSLGLNHDGQIRYWQDAMTGEIHEVKLEYYPGHPTPALSPTATTNWAPIMGVAYGKYLTQWSQGEYPNATNIEDDLSIITTQNGFDYRDDDIGNTIAEASAMVVDPLTADLDTSTITGQGIVERNTDVDYFSFTVEGLGELVSFDIQPFSEGPNLDILAKLYSSDGTLIATSNNISKISASFSEQGLLPGTYYISIEGDGRPITYVDPVAHPGPVQDDDTVPDGSDWGYSKYGSLGAYTITGTRKKGLVVGVDFDAAGGATPNNWTLYSGGSSPATLTNLKSEAGQPTPYQLKISSTNSTINTLNSGILGTNIPTHGVPLNEIKGYLNIPTGTLTFEWSNLQSSTVYQVYVFGHSNSAIQNHVTVVGGQWNGTSQVYDFVQTVDQNGMVVGDNAPGHEDLSNYAILVISDLSGKITITVSGANGAPAGVAGLAIAPTKVGSISGQKWNDANGNSNHDSGESALPDWLIYLDLNNDGQLNRTLPQNVTIQAPDVPQALQDYSTVKNEVIVSQVGTITDLNVTLDIEHTFDADVNVFLVSPAGTRVKLFGDIGGSGNNFHNTVLDDEALTAITSSTPPYTGTFRPQNPLSAFDGQNSAGKWTLEVQDDATGDTGTLQGWSLTFSLAGFYLEPFRLTDASGNYSFTKLPAGQYFVRESFTDEQKDAGWAQTLAPSPVTVRSGADVTGVDFGNWVPTTQHGSIQGLKFNDVNSNGTQDSGEAGLADWIIYIDANGNGARDVASSPTTVSATGLPKAITDFSTLNSSVTYSGLGTVFNIEVTLDITHSFVRDLDAYLISPSGRQVELFTAVGGQIGGQLNDFTNLTLSDSAARSIGTLSEADWPYTGAWRPEGLLSDFNGDDAAGTWTLQIRDTAFADQGTLNSWSLKITSGEVYRSTDADGKYSFADLPAGSYNVGEENQASWSQVPPASTTITAATWSNSEWHVTVSGVDNPGDPIPDSHRNVKNVNFGNHQSIALAGDYDRSNVVDASDYVLWRKKLGTSVAAPFDGADGNGNGTVDAADLGVWQAHYGNATPAGAGSLVLAASGSLDAPEASLLLSGDTGLEEATWASSTGRWFDLQSESTSATSVNSRPTYRPATFAANSSDQALLAWLAERGANEVTATDGTTIEPQAANDAESLDNAFESLEAMMLGDNGVV